MGTFDPTKPVQTRDGRPARILATDLNHGNMTLVVAVTEPEGMEFVLYYTKSGTTYASYGNGVSLVNAPEVRQGIPPPQPIAWAGQGIPSPQPVAWADQARKLDMTSVVQTRDGRPARIVAVDRAGSDYSVLALVRCLNGTEIPSVYLPNGRVHADRECSADLVPAPETITRSMNIYRRKGELGVGRLYKKRADADRIAKKSSGFVETREITITVNEESADD